MWWRRDSPWPRFTQLFQIISVLLSVSYAALRSNAGCSSLSLGSASQSWLFPWEDTALSGISRGCIHTNLITEGIFVFDTDFPSKGQSVPTDVVCVRSFPWALPGAVCMLQGHQGEAKAVLLPQSSQQLAEPEPGLRDNMLQVFFGNVGQPVRMSYKSYHRWEVIWLGAKDASYLICSSMVDLILFCLKGQRPYPWIHQHYCFIILSAKMYGCQHYANISAIISNDMEKIMLACQKASLGKNK